MADQLTPEKYALILLRSPEFPLSIQDWASDLEAARALVLFARGCADTVALGPNHKCSTWSYSGEGYNRVRVCACGAEDHDPETEDHNG